MTSYGGFKWPKKGKVKASNWDPRPEYIGGLYGWLWGEGDGSVADVKPDCKWLVVSVRESEIVDCSGKVKFPRGEVIYSGNKKMATAIIKYYHPSTQIIGDTCTYFGTEINAIAADYSSVEIQGTRGVVVGGFGSHVSLGRYGIGTADIEGSVTTDESGVVIGCDAHQVIAGDYGIAIDNSPIWPNSYLAAGNHGLLIARWSSAKEPIKRKIVIGRIGEKGLKPDTFYRLSSKMKWVECGPVTEAHRRGKRFNENRKP
jgi:hypothetical protein